MEKLKEIIKRGDVFYAQLGNNVVGSEQGGYRPVLILQNNKGNKYSTTVIVAPITTIEKHLYQPTHVLLKNSGLKHRSVALLEQVKTISKERLDDYICTINDKDLVEINKALKVSLGLGEI